MDVFLENKNYIWKNSRMNDSKGIQQPNVNSYDKIQTEKITFREYKNIHNIMQSICISQIF